VIGSLLIPFFYGIDFLPSVKPFLWLLPGILGITLSKIVSANLAGIGKPQYATYSSGITVVITVVLDILLIPPYGIVGAAIASSIAYLLSAVLSVMWFSRETNIRWLDVVLPRKDDFTLLVNRSMQLIVSTRSILSSRLSRFKSG
jgi:O-antigen/teichoic acid export membrane protein